MAFPIPPPVIAQTQADFLALFDRILPASYLDPIKQVGPGYELLQAYAKIAEALSNSVQIAGSDLQASTASDGAFATGTVQLSRPQPASSGQQLPGQAGNTASIVTGAAGGNMRVSGLSGMSANSVGHYLVLSNTFYVQNTGGFLITAFVNNTTVDVANASAVIPDLADGAISWSEQNWVVTVKAGTVVSASIGGQQFVTTADVVFNPTDVGPFDVAVQAVAFGYEYNVPGKFTAANGFDVIPGAIDTVTTLIEEPALGDISIQVSQNTATSGGADSALDAIGNDRGIVRQPGEAADRYRARLRTLPDTVSPNAVIRTVRALTYPIGIGFSHIETWQVSYQSCYDSPSVEFPNTDFDPNLFVYDDPRPTLPFNNRWLDENDYRGGIIVVVGAAQPLADVGMAYDDTALNVQDLQSPLSHGARACCAYDVPSDLGFGFLQGGYDGFDLPRQALYKGLYDLLQAIKAGGVSSVLELAGQ